MCSHQWRIGPAAIHFLGNLNCCAVLAARGSSAPSIHTVRHIDGSSRGTAQAARGGEHQSLARGASRGVGLSARGGVRGGHIHFSYKHGGDTANAGTVLTAMTVGVAHATPFAIDRREICASDSPFIFSLLSMLWRTARPPTR